MKNVIVEFDEFDENQVIADREEVQKYIPQRHEMSQLDGILFEDTEGRRCVGFKDLSENEFWIRGHMPDLPLMPGVLMCEAAAQLIAYFIGKFQYKDKGIVGFAGIDKVRFRNIVKPGNRLILMIVVDKVRPNVMVACSFQGYVNRELVVEGSIKGMIIPDTVAS